MLNRDDRWWLTATLVIVARNMVLAYGRRGSWALACSRIAGIRRDHMTLWSRETQLCLDAAADAGWITTPSGSVRTYLTPAGVRILAGRLSTEQIDAIGDVEVWPT